MPRTRLTPSSPLVTAAAACLALCLPAAGRAATDKLALTGGVSSIEGAAGGGLTPWAVIGSNATAGQWGASVFATAVRTQDHRLAVGGVAVGWNERVEFSLARQRFDTGGTGTAMGLPGLVLQQDVVAAKWRVSGDAVLDSDRWAPALALGVQFKAVDAGGLRPTLDALGAHTHGMDLTMSATKLLLARGLLVNATLRATRANQAGLLGFGGSAHSGYTLQPELSLAWLLNRRLALGAEWRSKPDRLNPSLLGEGLKEDRWLDVFVAWAPCPHASLTAAWVDLGRIVPAVQGQRQTGAYLSAQLAF